MARRESGKKGTRKTGLRKKKPRTDGAGSGAKATARETRSTRSPAAPNDASNGTSNGASNGDAWPDRRAVLFKPERLKYVRKQIETQGCVFCEAVAKGVKPESLVLFADDVKMVIMNKYPYNTGHLLVLPRRHQGDMIELTKAEVDQVFEMTQSCVKFLKDAYKPAGFNVGINLGVGAGAGIPEHLHVHIIPRWNGDTNFFPLIAKTKVVVETLEQTYERLIPYFDDLA